MGISEPCFWVDISCIWWMEWGFTPLLRLELPHYDLLSLLTAANSCFLSISLYLFLFRFFSLCEWFLCFAKTCGGVERGFKCNDPPPLFFWWISAFFSASLWWRQGSFKPGSAHGRLLSQRCPLSTVLACWRKRGWGSSLADPVIPRKAYMSTHAGFLISLHVREVRAKRAFIFTRQWSSFSQDSRM